MDIENQYIKQNTICPNLLGEIKYTYNGIPYRLETTKSVKIHYDADLNKYRLLVPESVQVTQTKSTKYVGIDSGVNTFQTCLSNNEILKIGTNLKLKIKGYLQRIDKIKKEEVNDNIKKYKVKKILCKNKSISK